MYCRLFAFWWLCLEILAALVIVQGAGGVLIDVLQSFAGTDGNAGDGVFCLKTDKMEWVCHSKLNF